MCGGLNLTIQLQNSRGRFESLSVRQRNFEFTKISHPEVLEGCAETGST
jgi:hypothetical protein